MVGHLLTVTSGVRALYVEAGWPRTPRDGVVRGGGLACAQIRHLGIKRATEELLLTKMVSGVPSWNLMEEARRRGVFHEEDIRRHLNLLLDHPT